MSDEKALYYVQRQQDKVGNCVSWWRKDNQGYTCNLDEAREFTKAEALEALNAGDTPWPVDYVRKRAVSHVLYHSLLKTDVLDFKKL